MSPNFTILASSPQLGSYNKFHILANRVIQASILDWEKSKKDKRTILREKKAKKKEIRRYKENRKRRSIKRDNGKAWFGKNRYIRRNYGKIIVE